MSAYTLLVVIAILQGYFCQSIGPYDCERKPLERYWEEEETNSGDFFTSYSHDVRADGREIVHLTVTATELEIDNIVFQVLTDEGDTVGEFHAPSTSYNPNDAPVRISTKSCQGYDDTLLAETGDGPQGINDMSIVWVSPIPRAAQEVVFKATIMHVDQRFWTVTTDTITLTENTEEVTVMVSDDESAEAGEPSSESSASSMESEPSSEADPQEEVSVDMDPIEDSYYPDESDPVPVYNSEEEPADGVGEPDVGSEEDGSNTGEANADTREDGAEEIDCEGLTDAECRRAEMRRLAEEQRRLMVEERERQREQRELEEREREEREREEMEGEESITSIDEASNNHGDDESSNGGDSYGWADIDDDEIDLDLDDEDDPHQIRLETRMSIAARALRQRILESEDAAGEGSFMVELERERERHEEEIHQEMMDYAERRENEQLARHARILAEIRDQEEYEMEKAQEERLRAQDEERQRMNEINLDEDEDYADDSSEEDTTYANGEKIKLSVVTICIMGAIYLLH